MANNDYTGPRKFIYISIQNIREFFKNFINLRITSKQENSEKLQGDENDKKSRSVILRNENEINCSQNFELPQEEDKKEHSKSNMPVNASEIEIDGTSPNYRKKTEKYSLVELDIEKNIKLPVNFEFFMKDEFVNTKIYLQIPKSFESMYTINFKIISKEYKTNEVNADKYVILNDSNNNALDLCDFKLQPTRSIESDNCAEGPDAHRNIRTKENEYDVKNNNPENTSDNNVNEEEKNVKMNLKCAEKRDLHADKPCNSYRTYIKELFNYDNGLKKPTMYEISIDFTHEEFISIIPTVLALKSYRLLKNIFGLRQLEITKQIFNACENKFSVVDFLSSMDSINFRLLLADEKCANIFLKHVVIFLKIYFEKKEKQQYTSSVECADIKIPRCLYFESISAGEENTNKLTCPNNEIFEIFGILKNISIDTEKCFQIVLNALKCIPVRYLTNFSSIFRMMDDNFLFELVENMPISEYPHLFKVNFLKFHQQIYENIRKKSIRSRFIILENLMGSSDSEKIQLYLDDKSNFEASNAANKNKNSHNDYHEKCCIANKEFFNFSEDRPIKVIKNLLKRLSLENTGIILSRIIVELQENTHTIIDVILADIEKSDCLIPVYSKFVVEMPDLFYELFYLFTIKKIFGYNRESYDSDERAFNNLNNFLVKTFFTSNNNIKKDKIQNSNFHNNSLNFKSSGHEELAKKIENDKYSGSFQRISDIHKPINMFLRHSLTCKNFIFVYLIENLIDENNFPRWIIPLIQNSHIEIFQYTKYTLDSKLELADRYFVKYMQLLELAENTHISIDVSGIASINSSLADESYCNKTNSSIFGNTSNLSNDMMENQFKRIAKVIENDFYNLIGILPSEILRISRYLENETVNEIITSISNKFNTIDHSNNENKKIQSVSAAIQSKDFDKINVGDVLQINSKFQEQFLKNLILLIKSKEFFGNFTTSEKISTPFYSENAVKFLETIGKMQKYKSLDLLIQSCLSILELRRRKLLLNIDSNDIKQTLISEYSTLNDNLNITSKKDKAQNDLQSNSSNGSNIDFGKKITLSNENDKSISVDAIKIQYNIASNDTKSKINDRNISYNDSKSTGTAFMSAQAEEKKLKILKFSQPGENNKKIIRGWTDYDYSQTNSYRESYKYRENEMIDNVSAFKIGKLRENETKEYNKFDNLNKIYINNKNEHKYTISKETEETVYRKPTIKDSNISLDWDQKVNTRNNFHDGWSSNKKNDEWVKNDKKTIHSLGENNNNYGRTEIYQINKSELKKNESDTSNKDHDKNLISTSSSSNKKETEKFDICIGEDKFSLSCVDNTSTIKMQETGLSNEKSVETLKNIAKKDENIVLKENDEKIEVQLLSKQEEKLETIFPEIIEIKSIEKLPLIISEDKLEKNTDISKVQYDEKLSASSPISTFKTPQNSDIDKIEAQKKHTLINNIEIIQPLIVTNIPEKTDHIIDKDAQENIATFTYIKKDQYGGLSYQNRFNSSRSNIHKIYEQNNNFHESNNSAVSNRSPSTSFNRAEVGYYGRQTYHQNKTYSNRDNFHHKFRDHNNQTYNQYDRNTYNTNYRLHKNYNEDSFRSHQNVKFNETNFRQSNTPIQTFIEVIIFQIIQIIKEKRQLKTGKKDLVLKKMMINSAATFSVEKGRF
ncbi:hypothetical protein EDEG_03805 [Edhazardia aedis USNM 41457]|uniref:Uncharacterized protein n=1 Tax=Edhazardia aedis (strain USNM 41457) TaxID=1003232 RepID=J8ZPP0_EDHAE|nr:hypothetical protein EDEG_03805 [Edhazardia aedis USNM 41457]|eukprot:EJW01653.1 hypothetical protein EDEG_03805 [Edhazardia aedis USNM 41457]